MYRFSASRWLTYWFTSKFIFLYSSTSHKFFAQNQGSPFSLAAVLTIPNTRFSKTATCAASFLLAFFLLKKITQSCHFHEITYWGISITAITITVITVFTEGVSEGKENVKCNLTIYIYKYIIYIVSSGMRKRKVFRETVITVIVIALWGEKLWFVSWENYGLLYLKLWFLFFKIMS